MNKLLLILLITSVVISCKKKEEQPIDMVARLNGSWDIYQLNFSTTVPFDGIMVPIIGQVPGQGEPPRSLGQFTIDADKMFANYNVGFKPNLILPNGDEPFDTISFVGNGPVTISLQNIVLTDTATTQVYNFKVETNEVNRQVWSIKVPFEIDSVTNTTVNLNLTMRKK